MKDKNIKRNLLMYPLGTVGRDMTYVLVANYLLTYIMFTRNLTPAQLGAVTAIMVGARIFDALNDPIMGNIIERTRTKWGKFKPWMCIGVLSTSVVVYLMYSSTLQGWDFIIFFGIIYICYSITYTMSDISYWGMVPALTSDADARNQFTSRATLFAGIGNTLATLAIPILSTGAMALGGNAKTAYSRIALIIGIIAPLFMLFTLFGVKETRDESNVEPPKVSLKKIVTTFTKNDQLAWICIIFLIQQIANNLVLGGLGATYIYFEFGYEGGLYSTFSTIGIAATAILMVTYPAISRRIERKKFMGYMAIVSAVGYAMMLISGLALRGSSMQFTILVIGYMAGNFGIYSYYLIMMISVMNTVEYNEYKFGTRDEGIITSARPFITKLSTALTVVITYVIYMIFNISDFTNQISDFENAAAAGTIDETAKLEGIAGVLANINGSQTLGLLFCISILPCVLMIISYFLYKSKYNLDEAEYEHIRAELEKR